MEIYADTSFLLSMYCNEAESLRALKWMQKAAQPIPLTPFHRHEIRTAVRQKVLRGEMTVADRKQAFADLDSDIAENLLIHTGVPWTEAFREAERIGQAEGEQLAIRSSDLLHVGIALVLRSEKFLTFDVRQATLAKAAGLKLLQI